jgi:acyl carrier protein
MLEALPLTDSGKVDRRALPAPPLARPVLGRPYASPATSLESELARIWEELLGVSPVGRDDDFLDLGGDSLLAAAMLTRIDDGLGIDVPVSALAGSGTVTELARAILDRERDRLATPLVEVRGGEGVPFVYAHGDYLGGGLHCSRLARALGDRPFYAIAPHGLDGDPVPRTIEAMAAERIAALRERVPEGPYALGGHCQVGGLAAFEMALQLAEAGEFVPFVTLIGAIPPAGRPGGVGRLGSLATDARKVLRSARGARDPHLQYGGPFRRYEPRAFGGRVLLLWPREGTVARPEEAAAAWQPLAGAVDLHVVPGNHYTSMIDSVEAVADPLREALREAAQPSSAAT